MPVTMTKPPDNSSEDSGDALEAARREKLRKIVALGIDPWGSRFDNHQAIGNIRLRESEIITSPAAGEGQHPASSTDPASAPPAASCCCATPAS